MRVYDMKSVNALSRAQSISTISTKGDEIYQRCVNALSRAQSISTITRDYISKSGGKCQCPKSGSIHFY